VAAPALLFFGFCFYGTVSEATKTDRQEHRNPLVNDYRTAQPTRHESLELHSESVTVDTTRHEGQSRHLTPPHCTVYTTHTLCGVGWCTEDMAIHPSTNDRIRYVLPPFYAPLSKACLSEPHM
jgi:hypothetical protein